MEKSVKGGIKHGYLTNAQSIFKSIAAHEQYVGCAGVNKKQDSGTQCLVTTPSACIIFSQNRDEQFFFCTIQMTPKRVSLILTV